MKNSTKSLKEIKQENEILAMKNRDLVDTLKGKGLPVFGTLAQK
jgi:hypothetical protein